MNKAKRILSLMLVLLCMVACLPTATAVEEPTAYSNYPEPGTGSIDLPEEFFLTQVGSGTCTLCSASMMIRHTLYINDNHHWKMADETAVRPYGWYSGVGLKWEFTYVIDDTTVRVGHQPVNGLSVQSLKEILAKHPEGIVLYCGNLPHAVFLYDYEGDIFYCAETVKGYAGQRIKLEDSWLGYRYGTQSWLLANVTAYWYIKDYTDDTGSRDCSCTARYAGTYVCTTSSTGLFIRNGHSTDSDVLGLIPSGETVTVHRTSGKGYDAWAHVSYNGINGYCALRYLQMVEPKHDFETTVVKPDCLNPGYTIYTCSGCGIKMTDDHVAALGHSYGAWTNADHPGEQIRHCVRCDATETREAESGLMGTITGSQLRIRSGAGTGYGVVGFLDKGDRVEILEVKDVGSEVWGRISQGWISMRYVKLDEPSNEEPPVTEPPVTEPPVTEPPVTEPPVTEPPVVQTGRMGTVTASCLCVRSGAGTGNSVVGYLFSGDRVEILEQQTVAGMTWGRTSQGWISMSYVEMDPVEETPAEPHMVMVNTGCLRIRAEANTSSTIVGFLYWGAQVEILETKDVDGMTWGRIENGWISMDYVEEI